MPKKQREDEEKTDKSDMDKLDQFVDDFFKVKVKPEKIEKKGDSNGKT